MIDLLSNGLRIGRQTDHGALPQQIGQRGQLVDLQAPLVQLPQLTTPPEQFMQQRCLVLVELFWQYGVVQACAAADGSSSSSIALLSRPNDLPMFPEPFAQQRARRAALGICRVRRPCRWLGDHDGR